MTEAKIARALWNKWGRGADIVARNIKMYPFESDVLMLRHSGYLTEYEIKLSVSDFNADSKKSYGVTSTSKYDWLQSGKGPNRFCYVMHEQMMQKVDIPSWAGLITFWENVSLDQLSHTILTIRKPAKLLHKRISDDTVREQMMICMYYKYWNNLK